MAAENEGEVKKKTTPPSSSAPLPPPRPTLSLPPRNTGFGFGADVSPGPMTLVSSFFSEDPDECRSFSQLLAGAIASSPVGVARGLGPTEEESGGGGGDGSAERGRGRWELNSSTSSSFLTVSPGISPTSLMDSPAFFSPTQGQFGISHQQALAHVTAQAVWSSSHVSAQAEYPPVSAAAASAMHPTTSDSTAFQQMPTQISDTKHTTLELADGLHADQRSQSSSITVDKPADDGYNWRKYGQKQVKGSEFPRSYYKCTHPNCPVKKKVERSPDGQVSEIIYKGQHNHERPPPGRRAKEGNILVNESNGSLNVTEADSHIQSGNYIRSSESYRRDQEPGQSTTDQLSGSSDGEEMGDAEGRKTDRNDDMPDAKRRNVDTGVAKSGTSHKTVTEPRIIVETKSEVDLLDDGYRWRKYGQKVVKGNPHPRSYYKCTYSGCTVRKHVERASNDSKAVITTYEGKHNHDVPAARNSSHNTANAGAAVNVIQPKVRNAANNQALRRIELGGGDQHSTAVLQLKEEHDLT